MLNRWMYYGNSRETRNQLVRERAIREHDNLVGCSCAMCGNPRRYTGRVTHQEERAALEAREQMRD